MSTYCNDNQAETTKNVCEKFTILESYDEHSDCDALNYVLWI
jgi:hypothetical protein